MWAFILRRLLIFIPFLFLVSMVSFVVIQLPPGNYVTTYVQNLEAQGGTVSAQEVKALEAEYGLNQPLPVEYADWIKGIVLHGNFGKSFLFDRPVASVLAERIPRSLGLDVSAILLTWLLALPLAIICALKKYSVWDHAFTFASFIGLAVPSFLVALVVMYFIYEHTGFMVDGFFSPVYQSAPWSLAKFANLLEDIWLPIAILALSNVAGVFRVLRASLLDELTKPYVMTARAKGISEWKVILRYPVRIALNPLISTIGWLLPGAIGAEVVVSNVLNLPTAGPALLQAIQSQDVYLTGGIVLVLSAMTIFGTLLSDVMLALLDPRIRYD